MKKSEEKKLKRKQNIAIAIAVIAILLAVSALGLLLKNDHYGLVKGTDGPQGIQGIQGKTGERGLRGIQGEQGPKGDRGLSGLSGSDGSNGRNGKDCIPNKAPVIENISLNGTWWYVPCTRYYYQFNLTVSIDDPENDNLHIYTYYRFNESFEWEKIQEYIGSDGIYNITKTICRFFEPVNQTIYLLVEVWDGSDISLADYTYTIEVD